MAVPSAPAAPTVLAVYWNGARVTFNAPSSNGGKPVEVHGIQFATNSGFTTGVINRTWDTAREQGHVGLTADTQYWVRVREYNADGWGPYSAAATFRTLTATPGAPGTPTISDLTPFTCTASWTAPSHIGSGAITSYALQIARNSAFTEGLSTVNVTGSLSREIFGMLRATNYWVRVRAANASGAGPWSAVRTFRSPAELPIIGTSGVASTVSRNSAVISSFSVADNGGEAPIDVRVQYNTVATSAGAQVVTRGSWADVTLPGLAATTRYYFRTAARNSAGWSEYGAWEVFETVSNVPDDIATPNVTGITEAQATASWNQPAANGATITGYRWGLSKSSAFSPVLRSGVTSTSTFSLLLTELEPGTEYFLRVRAQATPDNGGWGTTSFRTVGGRGLKIFTFVGGVRKELKAYTFVGGVRKELSVLIQRDGIMEGL